MESDVGVVVGHVAEAHSTAHAEIDTVVAHTGTEAPEAVETMEGEAFLVIGIERYVVTVLDVEVILGGEADLEFRTCEYINLPFGSEVEVVAEVEGDARIFRCL